MRRIMFVCLVFGVLGLRGTVHGEPVPVLVSIAPQKYFVERMGGDRVQVSVMVLPGSNPHAYEPKPRQMTELSRAKLYVASGMPFEEVWLPRFIRINPSLRVVHSDDWIRKRPMEAGHSHDEDGAGHTGRRHEHEEGTDPHTWLSPPRVMLQARLLLDGLTEVDPDGILHYEGGYRRFITELVELDLELRRTLGTMRGSRRFMVFHPSWGYFADTYGLIQMPIELEGKEPKPADLKRFIQEARRLEIRTVFVQPQFSAKTAETIAGALEGRVSVADPLAENWAEALRGFAKALADPGSAVNRP